MHVLIVPSLSMPIPTRGYGGSQRVICWLTEELMRIGCAHAQEEGKKNKLAVTLIGVKGSTATAMLPITCVAMKAKRGATKKDYLKYFKQIKTKLGNNNISIIHGHGHWIQWISNFFPNVPIVCTTHGYGEDLPTTAHLVFISKSQKKDFCALFPQTPAVANSKVIYNPIPTDNYHFREKKDDYFLFMAKIDWKVKGFNVALSVAKTTGIKLMVCGPGMSFWQKVRLPKNVRYLGIVGGERKKELLAGAKALLYPTLWSEPFGLAPAEANASGTPCLVFNNGAMSEVIADGVSGYLCGNTASELIAKISLLPKLSSKKCKNWTNKQFAVEKIARQYLSYYQSILQKKL